MTVLRDVGLPPQGGTGPDWLGRARGLWRGAFARLAATPWPPSQCCEACGGKGGFLELQQPHGVRACWACGGTGRAPDGPA